MARWSIPILLLVLALACGDDDDSAADASVRDAAPDGQIADSGATNPPTRPTIPAAHHESCAALAPKYDGSACKTACPALRSICDPFPASYIVCNKDLGCLKAIDCAVACER